jgi:hypothetical protein
MQQPFHEAVKIIVGGNGWDLIPLDWKVGASLQKAY